MALQVSYRSLFEAFLCIFTLYSGAAPSLCVGGGWSLCEALLCSAAWKPSHSQAAGEATVPSLSPLSSLRPSLSFSYHLLTLSCASHSLSPPSRFSSPCWISSYS